MAAPVHADAGGVAAFVARVLAGEQRAGARAMRLVDDRHPLACSVLQQLWPHTGRARIIGVTGNPGSGKSTLTDQLIRHYRAEGLQVGVVAVDPSSPFTGGAILGDRIRMSEHATDPGVFIRSMATRGHLGGLSTSTIDVVAILDAMGFDVVILETVGVGQDEIEVVKVAQTSVVVLVPGLGDDIQAIKAGLLEIADVFVVNKADRDGADRTVGDLHVMQHLVEHNASWTPPVVRTVALDGRGVAELVEAIAAHAERPTSAPEVAERRRRRELHILEALVLDRLTTSMREAMGDGPERQALLDALSTRATDPYSEADRIVAEIRSGKA